MFNEIKTRFIAAVTLAAAGAFCLTSCGGGDSEAAAKCLADAQTMLNERDFAGALAELDSLDARYPREADARRQAIAMRPRIIEAQSLAELQTADSLIAVLTLRSDSLKATLQHVSDAFEGYYTTKALAGKVPAQASGLYARMTTEGVYTVVASSTKAAKSTAVTLTADGQSVTTPEVAEDGERNDRSRGVEIINFMPAECDTLGVFAADHAGAKFTLTFQGAKPWSMPLPQEQAAALADVYRASKVYTALRHETLRKERLERLLQVARNQMARKYAADSVASE